jgi:hypothetical protein
LAGQNDRGFAAVSFDELSVADSDNAGARVKFALIAIRGKSFLHPMSDQQSLPKCIYVATNKALQW